MPVPTVTNQLGLAWLGLAGTALTCALWFRGVARLESAPVSSLLFLSPSTAVLLGWVFLGQSLTWLQLAGVGLVLGQYLVEPARLEFQGKSRVRFACRAWGGEWPVSYSPVNAWNDHRLCNKKKEAGDRVEQIG